MSLKIRSRQLILINESYVNIKNIYNTLQSFPSKSQEKWKNMLGKYFCSGYQFMKEKELGLIWAAVGQQVCSGQKKFFSTVGGRNTFFKRQSNLERPSPGQTGTGTMPTMFCKNDNWNGGISFYCCYYFLQEYAVKYVNIIPDYTAILNYKWERILQT